MKGFDLSDNPFRVFTPEDMEAADVAELFVDPPDVIKIEGRGHMMLNGARGCGKSMIFRYLLSDCQRIARNVPVRDLPFLAFLVSIKNAGPTPTLTEFLRLKNKHANIVMNEHVLTAFVATRVFSALSRIELPSDSNAAREASDYYNNHFKKRMTMSGAAVDALSTVLPPPDVFGRIADACDMGYSEIVQYVKRLSAEQPAPYRGALWDYTDFLYPLLVELKRLSFLPSSPIYLLVDDGDYLNQAQTMILNSWISTRTQADVSIKVSTQLSYKTLQTMSGLPIQSPHDFQTLNISDLYTTRRGRYRDRVKQIVAKRLTKGNIECTPEEFFPHDEKQERAIEGIAREIRSKWLEEGRGHRPSDDAIRYARPDYIRSLGGRSKSSYTYSYSGFNQLVHISSGLVRYFLESAARMFDEQRSRLHGRSMKFIAPSVQDEITRICADEFMTSEFDQMAADAAIGDQREPNEPVDEMHLGMGQLRNIIRALGGTFYLKLISNDAERRVFSVAISGRADPDVVRVLTLGVRYGYFHRSTIGDKDGTGRTQLYILTRRLAPYFKLDPSSFAGYLWVTNEAMRKAMDNPDATLRRMKTEGLAEFFKDSQLELFDDFDRSTD